MPDNFASNGEGLTIVVNGIDLPQMWNSYSSTLEPAGLIAPTTVAQAAGSGVGSLNGTYFIYVSYIRRDGFESSMSPSSGDFLLTNNAQIDYTDIPTSTDPRVVARRIYRNTDGEARAVYLDVQIDDNVTTTATSSKSDTILQAGLAFPLFDDFGRGDIIRTLNANPPPDTKPYVAFLLGRAYYYGHTDYSEGSCEVTSGSAVVQGRGTRWKSNWAARLLYVDGADATYEIESVDETLQQITLTTPYLGTTNLFAAYTVRPSPAECAILYISEAGYPEKVSPFNGVAVPDDDDVGTGLLVLSSFLYILKRKSIYRFTCGKNPVNDGSIFQANSRGCIAQRCAWSTGDKAFLLDERGAYVFGGSEDMQEISNQIQDLFRDGSDTPINWGASRFFHAVPSPGESVIRWFVNFRGDYQPRHALCFCYTLGRWWIEYYNRPIGGGVLGQSGRVATGWGRNVEQVYYGVDAGEILGLVQGVPDIVTDNRAEPVTVLASGLTSVTVDRVADSSMVGCAVVHRSKASAALQQRRIVAVSNRTLTVHPPWGVLPVAEDDEIFIGGFAWQYRTGQFRFAPSETAQERDVEVFFDTNPGSKFDLQVYQDGTPNTSACDLQARANFGVQAVKDRTSQRVDFAKREGFALIQFGGHREVQTDGRRAMAIELQGCGGNGLDVISQMVLKGVLGG